MRLAAEILVSSLEYSSRMAIEQSFIMSEFKPPFWGQVSNAYPLPGYAPKDFAQKIPMPKNAQSLFSVAKTKEGDKCLGPRPDDAKPRSIEAREKAEYLIWKFPAIANTINSPVKCWRDLYDYFDATDIMADGACHLYNVIALIATVNATKDADIVQKMTFWAHQNKDKVMSGLPLTPGEQEVLCIHDSELQRYEEVLALTLNLLAGTFKWEEETRAVEAVRKACFLSPPICSSTLDPLKLDPYRHFNLPGKPSSTLSYQFTFISSNT